MAAPAAASYTLLTCGKNKDLFQLLRIALGAHEWTIETFPHANGPRPAIEMLRPAIILVDADHDTGGVHLREAVESSSIIVVVTSDRRDQRALELHALGAHMVYAMPVAPDLLAARLTAIIHCVAKSKGLAAQAYTFAGLAFDTSGGVVSVYGRPVRLAAMEYRLLRVLVENSGRILAPAQLLDDVWGPGYEENPDVLRTCMSSLRRRLRDAGLKTPFIQTERQLGYWVPRSESLDPLANRPFTPAGGTRAAATDARAQHRQLTARLSQRTHELLETTQRLRATMHALQS